MPHETTYTLNFLLSEASYYAFLLIQERYGIEPEDNSLSAAIPQIIFSVRTLEQSEFQRLIKATRPISFTSTEEIVCACVCCLGAVCETCKQQAETCLDEFIIDPHLRWGVLDLSGLCYSCLEAAAYCSGYSIPRSPREELVLAWMDSQAAREEVQHG